MPRVGAQYYGPNERLRRALTQLEAAKEESHVAPLARHRLALEGEDYSLAWEFAGGVVKEIKDCEKYELLEVISALVKEVSRQQVLLSKAASTDSGTGTE